MLKAAVYLPWLSLLLLDVAILSATMSNALPPVLIVKFLSLGV